MRKNKSAPYRQAYHPDLSIPLGLGKHCSNCGILLLNWKGMVAGVAD